MAVPPILTHVYSGSAPAYSARERMDALAVSISDSLSVALPKGFSAATHINDLSDDDEFELSVWAINPDRKTVGRFDAQFYFDSRTCAIFRLAVPAAQHGKGVGKLMVTHFMKESYRAGFEDFALSTKEVGSYFWAASGFYTDTVEHLQSRLGQRFDVLKQWVPENVISQAADISSKLGAHPENLQVLARLDCHDYLGVSFSIAASCEKPKPHIRPEQTVTFNYLSGIRSHMPENKPMTLGQALLMGTGWEGYATLADPAQRTQIFETLGIKQEF